MDNPIFQKLQDIIERAPRTPQWFGMAEQAINTIYLLGEQPDQLCSFIIKNLTEKAFHPRSADVEHSRERATTPTQGDDDDGANGDVPPTPATLMPPDTPAIPPTPAWSIPPTPSMERSESQTSLKEDSTPSFALAQLVFTVGHVSIKHIVYLELVEREFKRRKDEQVKCEFKSFRSRLTIVKAAEKDKDATAASNDLDAVAGNAEDDIGDLIAGIREKELLYGEKSLLRVYGPLIGAICAQPKRYRVSHSGLIIADKSLPRFAWQLHWL
jgi:condensin complex subunit 1